MIPQGPRWLMCCQFLATRLLCNPTGAVVACISACERLWILYARLQRDSPRSASCFRAVLDELWELAASGFPAIGAERLGSLERAEALLLEEGYTWEAPEMARDALLRAAELSDCLRVGGALEARHVESVLGAPFECLMFVCMREEGDKNLFTTEDERRISGRPEFAAELQRLELDVMQLLEEVDAAASKARSVGVDLEQPEP